MMQANPYANLEQRAFWRTGVAESSPFSLKKIYLKKWDIHRDWRIATAGSCFAQHISNRLQRHNYNVIQAEPPPPGLGEEASRRFGYSTYSARYGNIYTVHQLRQLLREVLGKERPRDIVWEKGGRFFDALRPGVEPDGLETADLVLAHRAYHIKRVRSMISQMDLFIFTLGLTEAWIDRESGTVFPTAPGTIAGKYDPSKYKFKNFRSKEILDAFEDVQSMLAEIKGNGAPPNMILTISPVPLTATASGHHVLRATTHSKSVLRAVAGELADAYDHIDYFPSYEIVTNPAARGVFFEENLRSIRQEGVDVVMAAFFAEHEPQPAIPGDGASPASLERPLPDDLPETMEIQCEEAIIEAFAH